ncbi:16S rRNA (guanine(966)-N(2))-methyltransferase RsmD [Microbaculum marinisediminis]|uniref:16S rRNA (Guanine(966)-N(2))-methyltransferase RsmD n=1 Tax=Microbaculum marinisediminis TaxID=2931392 RepID=A0AAW5QVQ4_9HYPH|nr:16S rRNA (guanine(966)-N(2))-methyltransferase RsmD [Microbaculum sp. A6E488]MCT8970384.1 16S rRNA (guanine(966)-N(2))-methyltransferase RsmD [Microbaculum sp. A6E488]
MRVVGGRFKGLALAAPKGQAIRPTSDRLRESVFNILAHAYDDPVEGARVLDLCAGTGALGIEALSRGARSALFVDVSADARALIRRNLEAAGIMGLARISKRDVAHLGPAGAQGGFTLVFLDPPYGQGLADKALSSLAKGGWLADGALVVVEERAGVELDLPAGYTERERRAYGETEIAILSYGQS